MTPLKAIRQMCLGCCCGRAYEIKMCALKDCPLYPFRLGKNPNIKKREYTEEQKKAAAKRMLNARNFLKSQ